MCDPLTLGVGTFAIGAAQAGVGYLGQKQAADRQNAYAEQNRQAAITALGNTYAASNTQMVQERDAASHQLLDNEIKADQARGMALTSAGQAGIDGSASVNALMQSYFSQQGRSDESIGENFDMTKQNITANEAAAQGTAISRINSVPKAANPSILNAGLGIVGAGFAGAGQYYRDTNLQRGWMNPYGSNSSLGQAGGSY